MIKIILQALSIRHHHKNGNIKTVIHYCPIALNDFPNLNLQHTRMFRKVFETSIIWLRCTDSHSLSQHSTKCCIAFCLSSFL